MDNRLSNIRNRKIADKKTFGGYDLPRVKTLDEDYYTRQEENNNAWLDKIAEQVNFGQSISDMLCVDLTVSL